MSETLYRGRRAHKLSNGILEIIVTNEGGHIAAVTDLKTGINPLWSPPWKSIEPSTYDLSRHPEYGNNAESKLLAGILGHNLCLDLFGGPSGEEAAAGITVHGEASILPYRVAVEEETLFQAAEVKDPQLKFRRRIRLPAGTRVAEITETVENLANLDRPIAWTQHVTLGPPFLQKGATQFRSTATKSKVIEQNFSGAAGYMQTGAEFNWPMVPTIDTGADDLQTFTDRKASGAFTTHLMDQSATKAWFLAWNPEHQLAFGYVWNPKDFPWMGIWEENLSRTQPPWNGETITRGMEFGVSPFPESRRAMIDRRSLFGVPGYRWIPARTKVAVDYKLFLHPAATVPTKVEEL